MLRRSRHPACAEEQYSCAESGSREMKEMNKEARAELLTFLVVSQLFAFARTGEWLRTHHLIESSQNWLSSNGAVCDWLERA